MKFTLFLTILPLLVASQGPSDDPDVITSSDPAAPATPETPEDVNSSDDSDDDSSSNSNREFPNCTNYDTYVSCRDNAQNQISINCEPVQGQDDEYYPCMCEWTQREVLCFDQCPEGDAQAAKESFESSVTTFCNEAEKYETPKDRQRKSDDSDDSEDPSDEDDDEGTSGSSSDDNDDEPRTTAESSEGNGAEVLTTGLELFGGLVALMMAV